MHEWVSVNLIPQHESASRHRIARLRLWATVCVMELIALGVAGWWMTPSAAARDRAARRVQHMNERLRQERESLAADRQTLHVVRERSETAARLVVPRVWSTLLAFLAEQAPDEIVLTELQTTVEDSSPTNEAPVSNRASAGAASGVAVESRRGTIRISGYSVDHEHLTRFLKTLDESELFPVVRLDGTRREPFLGGRAVAFSVTCIW